MTSENRTWASLKNEYLHQIEKALASVKHPRSKEVVQDVRSHLDRRFADLKPQEQTWENFQAIITEMGPASDYADLLQPSAAPPPRRARRQYLFGVGLAAAVAIAAIVIPTAISDEKVGYIIAFQPVEPFEPQTARELLNAFNEEHPAGARTHHYRTQVRNESLVGLICVDTKAEKDAIVNMLGHSDKLILAGVRAVSQKDLERHYVMGQPSLNSTQADETYVVTFRPAAPYAPQTATDLLAAFNENHPRGVRTHHYRTEVRDNTLVGYICVDTKNGKDAIVSMVEKSKKLEFVAATLATESDLQKLYDMGQPSLRTRGGRDFASDRRSSSRRERPPAARYRTVSRTGTWPAGNCSVGGTVYREAGYGSVEHSKVCLSSEEMGSWVVETDYGHFDFVQIPAGLYTLRTADTFGYKETYYNPENKPEEQPNFQLKDAEERWQVRLKVEPVRPYLNVSGRVLDEAGKPVTDNPDLRVDAWLQLPQGHLEGYYRPVASSGVSQQDGSYLLKELDGRPIYVMVRDLNAYNKDNPYPPRFYPGTFSRGDAKMITFDNHESLENADIRLARRGGVALQGVVTDESTGEPVPNAMVVIRHADMLYDLFPGYTDERGSYRIEGLGEGSFLAYADAMYKGFVKTRKFFTIRPGAKETRLDISLRRGARISGKFVDEDGSPWQVERAHGSTFIPGAPYVGNASNFPYRNKYGTSVVWGTTVFYNAGEGDQPSSMMVYPTRDAFLIQAMMPGKTRIQFHPRTPRGRVLSILHDGKDIKDELILTEPGQEIKDVTIVIGTSGRK